MKDETLDRSLEEDSARSVTPPPGPVRGERWLIGVDRVLSRLDGWFARALPPELNPWTQAGRACNFALLVAVASGVLLLLWYSPSLQFAYSSLQPTAERSLAGGVRALHRYSSDLVMVLLLLHAGRMFLARKFAGARWVPWVSGVGLMALIWFIGWTGYWLVWDQPAQQIAVTSMRLLDGLPIFGEPMGRLYVSDRTVPSLLFFVVFFLHMLLPLGIAVGLAVHLLRVSRVKLLPDWRLSVALTIGLIIAAACVPAPLDAPAEMAEKPAQFTVDAWYLSPLALGLRFQHAGLWVALFGTTVSAMALPWILGRRRRPESFQTRVETSRCHACTQCVQDCPFEAVTMVPRTDGKRFVSEAWVDPSKCVGCGVCVGSCDSEAMSLVWFDTRREEARIEAEALAELDARPWVAFVAGDIDSGFALFAQTTWRERLPGYHVQFVPTASWVRPKFVERLLKSGVRGVLVVRDARAEAAARDGNRWIALRLQGERHPAFRPERAIGAMVPADGATAMDLERPQDRWRVLDFDPSKPAALSEAAELFRAPPARAKGDGSARDVTTGERERSVWRTVTAIAVLAVALAGATVLPSHFSVANPAPSDPEFVFSFKVFGDLVVAAAAETEEEATKPVHMRGRATAKPQRAAVRVRVSIDGVVTERSHRAKGISRDGPAIDQWREMLTPGAHEITVEVISGPETPSQTWRGTIDAKPRRLHVLTFEPDAGFRLETE